MTKIKIRPSPITYQNHNWEIKNIYSKKIEKNFLQKFHIIFLECSNKWFDKKYCYNQKKCNHKIFYMHTKKCWKNLKWWLKKTLYFIFHILFYNLKITFEYSYFCIKVKKTFFQSLFIQNASLSSLLEKKFFAKILLNLVA
jgi:hypothetical protein